MTGQDIRAFRQRERLSQEALGGVLGVIHSSISNWERGRHIPASHEAKLQELMGASRRDWRSCWMACQERRKNGANGSAQTL